MEDKIGSGYHFYSTFQDCPRKFWFKSILRFVPIFLSPSLLFGSMIHAGVAEYWRNKTLAGALEAFRRISQEKKEFYELPSKWVEDCDRGEVLLTEYHKTYVEELDRYEVLKIEEELNVDILGEYNFVFKPDRIVFDKKRKMVIIFEVKTTGFSAQKVFENVYDQEQATAYLFAWNKRNPGQKAEIVIPDILYNRGSVYTCTQSLGEVYRTTREQKDFEYAMYGLITEVTQKVQNLEHYPSIQLFPRRFKCDGDGFYKCEYKSICRMNINPLKPSIGFRIKEKSK